MVLQISILNFLAKLMISRDIFREEIYENRIKQNSDSKSLRSCE